MIDIHFDSLTELTLIVGTRVKFPNSIRAIIRAIDGNNRIQCCISIAQCVIIVIVLSAVYFLTLDKNNLKFSVAGLKSQ